MTRMFIYFKYCLFLNPPVHLGLMVHKLPSTMMFTQLQDESHSDCSTGAGNLLLSKFIVQLVLSQWVLLSSLLINTEFLLGIMTTRGETSSPLLMELFLILLRSAMQSLLLLPRGICYLMPAKIFLCCGGGGGGGRKKGRGLTSVFCCSTSSRCMASCHYSDGYFCTLPHRQCPDLLSVTPIQLHYCIGSLYMIHLSPVSHIQNQPVPVDSKEFGA